MKKFKRYLKTLCMFALTVSFTNLKPAYAGNCDHGGFVYQAEFGSSEAGYPKTQLTLGYIPATGELDVNRAVGGRPGARYYWEKSEFAVLNLRNNTGRSSINQSPTQYSAANAAADFFQILRPYYSWFYYTRRYMPVGDYAYAGTTGDLTWSWMMGQEFQTWAPYGATCVP
jgi:hypothetical protein